jgi:K(+)-stimulated pyrophosphate-energized sodium pump
MPFSSLVAASFLQANDVSIPTSDSLYLWVALAIGVVGLLAAFAFARSVLGSDSGSPEMQRISNAIRQGAEAFMRRQYGTIALIAVVLAIILFFGYRLSPFTAPYANKVVISFLIGAACSALSGQTGMWVSIRSNIRTASAARSSLGKALQIALRGGAVTGLVVVGLSLLGVGVLFLLFGGLRNPQEAPYQLVGFGFGASLVALFAQLGGGIYTKAADVGADLVGKVEAGIPEDDPRNPAVIADLVGDNVGDCAGRGADIFESTAAENVGAMILGAALYPVFGIKGILFPLIVQAINLVASIIGVSLVRSREDEDPMHALNKGYYVTTILALIGFAAAVYYMLQGRWWLLGCGICGIVTSFLFVRITEYYTETRFRPVRSIALASTTGPATNIISGLAVGMETPAIPVIVISAALLLSYYFGTLGLADVTTISAYSKGIYGTAIATMGMLSSAAYILAMDTFGPITDNAGGIIEMSNQPDAVREKTDKLDAAGNTTKALTKGYAIGSASLAAFLLFSAYLESVHNIVSQRVASADGVLPPSWSFSNINLASVPVFVGALLGAMLTYLFSSLAIKAVGRAAQTVIQDVHQQFRENPGIMEGTSQPDYGRCVGIVTGAALKEMVLPGVLVVAMPLAVGIIFRHFSSGFRLSEAASAPIVNGHALNLSGAEAVAALLMVGTISGILLAMLMNNGGGAWDNAKKFIETGQHGGKRSEAHKAAVVGDTVGDPFKDTAGPSLHVLIKLLATVTLVLAPLFV